MDLLTVVALLIIISAAFSYLNVRFLRMPGTIGVMVVAVAVSLIVLIAGRSYASFGDLVVRFTESIDFSRLLLDVMLGFLLFASALHFDAASLKAHRRSIFVLSTVGVLVSTIIFGLLIWGATSLLQIEMPFIYCLAFGALVSPTDPIAVAAILKKSNMPAPLATIISGESMFNDAVGLVLFVTLIDIPDPTTGPFSWSRTGLLFGQEVVGGVTIGLLAGYLGYRLIRSITDFQTILMVTFGIVFGISLVAAKLHASVPLAVVAAGLVIGNQKYGAGHAARQYLVRIWQLLDEVLNTILFVMIGLQLVLLRDLAQHWAIGLISIAAILVARLISVLLPAAIVVKKVNVGNLSMLTWAGLRGGISIAMALSIPPSPYRQVILAATYFIVIFSVVVQGLTLNKVIHAATKKTSRREKEAIAALP